MTRIYGEMLEPWQRSGHWIDLPVRHTFRSLKAFLRNSSMPSLCLVSAGESESNSHPSVSNLEGFRLRGSQAKWRSCLELRTRVGRRLRFCPSLCENALGYLIRAV